MHRLSSHATRNRGAHQADTGLELTPDSDRADAREGDTILVIALATVVSTLPSDWNSCRATPIIKKMLGSSHQIDSLQA